LLFVFPSRSEIPFFVSIRDLMCANCQFSFVAINGNHATLGALLWC